MHTGYFASETHLVLDISCIVMSNVYLLKFIFELESNFLSAHADLAGKHDSAVPLQVNTPNWWY